MTAVHVCTLTVTVGEQKAAMPLWYILTLVGSHVGRPRLLDNRAAGFIFKRHSSET